LRAGFWPSDRFLSSDGVAALARFPPWVSGLLWSREKKQASEDAQSEYARFLDVLANGTPEQVRARLKALKAADVASSLSSRKRKKLADEAFQTYADAVLADDVLTPEEEETLFDVCDAVGIDSDGLQLCESDLFFRLMIAKVNDGRLETIPDPHVMTKKNEVVHLEMVAGPDEEVTLREFRGGSAGFSFRIANGVRYRTGSFRGRSVVVGTELQVADSGPLAVTSSRVVFLGQRKTMEVPYSKLVGVEVFEDGIRFSASNRQNAPLFKLENGEVIAATVNAAVQRFNA
jgi:hypothetical protein